MAQKRTVVYENNEILYLLEQKQVKNLNLRVHKDCMVYVSANPDVPAEKVDDFVVSKGAYIRSAQRKFREIAQYASTQAICQRRDFLSAGQRSSPEGGEKCAGHNFL